MSNFSIGGLLKKIKRSAFFSHFVTFITVIALPLFAGAVIADCFWSILGIYSFYVVTSCCFMLALGKMLNLNNALLEKMKLYIGFDNIIIFVLLGVLPVSSGWLFADWLFDIMGFSWVYVGFLCYFVFTLYKVLDISSDALLSRVLHSADFSSLTGVVLFGAVPFFVGMVAADWFWDVLCTRYCEFILYYFIFASCTLLCVVEWVLVRKTKSYSVFGAFDDFMVIVLSVFVPLCVGVVVADLAQDFISAFGSCAVFLFYFVFGNLDMFFFTLWLVLVSSFFISWFKNPLHKILNLILLSITVVFLWGYCLDFTFVLLCYIIAFTSAVVMLFLSVVLMLPLSYSASLNFVFLLSIFSINLNEFRVFSAEVDYLGFFYICVFFFISFLLINFFLSKIWLKVLKKNSKLLSSVLVFYDYNYVVRLFSQGGVFGSIKNVDLLVLFQKFKKTSVINFISSGEERVGSGYLFFILTDTSAPLCSFLLQKNIFLSWRSFFKFLFLEFFLFVYAVLDGYVFKNLHVAHLSVLKFFEKCEKLGHSSLYKHVLNCILRFYLLVYDSWEVKKKSYPNRGTGWSVPLVVDVDKKTMCIVLFSWWNPYFIGLNFLNFLNFFLNKISVLFFFSYSVRFCFEWVVQCLVIFVIYSFFIPWSSFVFEFDNYESQKQNFFINNVENLVALKQFLYQNMPFFVLVSVNILLVALVSASLLKKK